MSEPHKCPVCGKFEFEYVGCHDICPICKWQDHFIQLEDPDATGCANLMSLNEAKAAWAKGLPIY